MIGLRCKLSCAAMLAFAAITADAQNIPAGSPDPTFGSGGQVLLDFGATDRAFDVLVTGSLLAGQRIIVAVIANNGVPGLVALNNDGSVDGSFGTGGIAIANVGDASFIAGVVEGDDGELVLAWSNPFYGQSDESDFVIQSFSANGTPLRQVSVNVTPQDMWSYYQYVSGIQAMDLQRAPDGSYYLLAAIQRQFNNGGFGEGNVVIAAFDRDLNRMVEAGDALNVSAMAYLGATNSRVAAPAEVAAVDGNAYAAMQPRSLLIRATDDISAYGGCVITTNSGTPSAAAPFFGQNTVNDAQLFGCGKRFDNVLRSVPVAPTWLYGLGNFDFRETVIQHAAREGNVLALYGTAERDFFSGGNRRYPIIAANVGSERPAPLWFIPPAAQFGDRSLDVVNGLRSGSRRFVVGSTSPCVAASNCTGSEVSNGFYVGATDGATFLDSYIGASDFGIAGWSTFRVVVPVGSIGTGFASVARAHAAVISPATFVGGAPGLLIVGQYDGRTVNNGPVSTNAFVTRVTLREIVVELPVNLFKDGFE